MTRIRRPWRNIYSQIWVSMLRLSTNVLTKDNKVKKKRKKILSIRINFEYQQQSSRVYIWSSVSETRPKVLPLESGTPGTFDLYRILSPFYLHRQEHVQ